jgi:ABC-type uncharacterized transport system substrate-binding protein
LRDLGYVEGKNIAIEFGWAESVEQLSELAAELVRMNVDIIFATSSTEVGIVQPLTKTIPIVATHADHIGVGHVESLSHQHYGILDANDRNGHQSAGSVEASAATHVHDPPQCPGRWTHELLAASPPSHAARGEPHRRF